MAPPASRRARPLTGCQRSAQTAGPIGSAPTSRAPLAVRGAAQGLVNIFTSIGTLLSATAIGALADFGGGGAPGYNQAYLGGAALMVAMLLITFGLRKGGAAHPPAESQN